MPKTLAPAEYEKNPNYLRPNETPQQYLNRTQGANAPTYQPPTIPSPITASSLQSPAQPVVVPPYNPPPTPVPDLTELIKQFNTPTDAENRAQSEQNALLGRIGGLLGEQGQEGARIAELEAQAGLPNLQKQQAEINAQIRGINVGAFTETQKQENRLAPTFAIAGSQAQIERQRAVQTFALSAASAALNDQVGLAQQNVANAISAEFGEREAQLNYQILLLDMNKERMSSAQQKKAQALEIVLNERSRLLEEERSNREGVYDIMTTVAQNGAPTSAINQIQNARSVSEAISLAAPYMQSPEAKLKLEGAKLDLELKKLQIATERKQYSMLGLPSAKDLADQQLALTQAQEKLPVIQDKINLISSLITHPGLNSAVGPTFLQRLPLIDVGGAKDDFIGGVAQLMNKETIDTLLDLKAKGGTLGALSDQERVLLQSAATKIGQWSIEKDNRIVGFDTSQSSFIKELNTLLELKKRAQERAIGNLVGPDERAAINSFQLNLQGSTPATFNPSI